MTEESLSGCNENLKSKLAVSEERDCCRSTHLSGSHGAVSSVRLRHISGKLWGDILVHGPGTQHTVSNQSKKGTVPTLKNSHSAAKRSAHDVANSSQPQT
jgi:hypothetical protein